jgi:hypothetical protein
LPQATLPRLIAEADQGGHNASERDKRKEKVVRLASWILFAAVLLLSQAQFAIAQNLQFPMKGSWFVLQGPPCPHFGNHCQAPSNHLAYDFVPVTPTPANPFGQPNPPACMGQPIMSPSSGEVVEASNMYSDMPIPGQHPAGNRVVIRKSPNEFIVIAHLMQNSLAVAPGASVKAGQPIGACGFNGSTNAPHVHIHMQAGPSILNFGTPPLPMLFNVNVRVPPTGACVPLGGNMLTIGMVTC